PGFEFVDTKKEQGMSNKDAEETKQGLEEALSKGLLLNYRLLDIKAILLERKIHTEDTNLGDFSRATVAAFCDNKEEKTKKN
ncbi:11073_t:CDS:1, partial [Gigaspora margarita]